MRIDAAHRQFQAAAQCKAVDRRDGRFAHRFEQPENLLPTTADAFRCDGIRGGDLRYIRSGDECLFTRAGQDQARISARLTGLRKASAKLRNQSRVQRVQLLRTADREKGNTIRIRLKREELKRHMG